MGHSVLSKNLLNTNAGRIIYMYKLHKQRKAANAIYTKMLFEFQNCR